MGKEKKQEEKSTKIKIEPISLEIYDRNDKLVSQIESPINASDAKQNKENIDIDNSAEKLQQNEKNGFIAGFKILTNLFPLISGMTIASIVVIQIFNANIAEQYYHIEKSIFFTEIVYDKLIYVGEFAILNMLILLLTIALYYNMKKKISLFFYIVVFLISCYVLALGLYAYAKGISQGIYPGEDINGITLCILKYPLVFILLLSFLGTVGFWIMINNFAAYHIKQKIQAFINIKRKIDKEDNKGEKVTQGSNLKSNKKNILKFVIAIFYAIFWVICVLSAMVVIGAWLWNFILGGAHIINKESYPKKKTYEIVQNNNNYPELTDTSGQITSASNIQVVILHRGSQVLLMNGEIDGNETINPQEDMSSSNLVIDTSSYEFQEASQYRFYRKTFNNVTTNAPKNNNQ